MNYAFQPADDTYVHFVSSQIREELGNAACLGEKYAANAMGSDPTDGGEVRL